MGVVLEKKIFYHIDIFRDNFAELVGQGKTKALHIS